MVANFKLNPPCNASNDGLKEFVTLLEDLNGALHHQWWIPYVRKLLFTSFFLYMIFFELVFQFELRGCGLKCDVAVCDAVLRLRCCGLVAVAVAVAVGTQHRIPGSGSHHIPCHVTTTFS